MIGPPGLDEPDLSNARSASSSMVCMDDTGTPSVEVTLRLVPQAGRSGPNGRELPVREIASAVVNPEDRGSASRRPSTASPATSAGRTGSRCVTRQTFSVGGASARDRQILAELGAEVLWNSCAIGRFSAERRKLSCGHAAADAEHLLQIMARRRSVGVISRSRRAASAPDDANCACTTGTVAALRSICRTSATRELSDRPGRRTTRATAARPRNASFGAGSGARPEQSALRSREVVVQADGKARKISAQIRATCRFDRRSLAFRDRRRADRRLTSQAQPDQSFAVGRHRQRGEPLEPAGKSRIQAARSSGTF